MLNLSTDRLNFRMWKASDFQPVADFFSNPEEAKFVGGTKTPEEAWRLIATYIGHYHLKGYSYLAVEEKASKALVGAVGLWNSEPWPELELGYWLLSHMQGRGYGTEAARKVRDYAFETLKTPTFVSYIDAENLASIRLAEKLGARRESNIQLLTFGPHCVYRHKQ